MTKKRQHDDLEAEELVSQICARMKDLSTTEAENNHDEIVAAFISVLNCTMDEATFYLESAIWDIQTAITFWLDSDRGYNARRLNGEDNYYQKSHNYQTPKYSKVEHLYTNKQVEITDLPNEWSAWVHASSGCIYFMNTITGHTQYSVPPGYADIVKSPFTDNITASSSALDNSSSTNNNNNNNSSNSYHRSPSHPIFDKPFDFIHQNNNEYTYNYDNNSNNLHYDEKSTDITDITFLENSKSLQSYKLLNNHNLMNIPHIDLIHIHIDNNNNNNQDNNTDECTESMRADCDSNRDFHEMTFHETNEDLLISDDRDENEDTTICNLNLISSSSTKNWTMDSSLVHPPLTSASLDPSISISNNNSYPHHHHHLPIGYHSNISHNDGIIGMGHITTSSTATNANNHNNNHNSSSNNSNGQEDIIYTTNSIASDQAIYHPHNSTATNTTNIIHVRPSSISYTPTSTSTSISINNSNSKNHSPMHGLPKTIIATTTTNNNNIHDNVSELVRSDSLYTYSDFLDNHHYSHSSNSNTYNTHAHITPLRLSSIQESGDDINTKTLMNLYSKDYTHSTIISNIMINESINNSSSSNKEGGYDDDDNEDDEDDDTNDDLLLEMSNSSGTSSNSSDEDT